MRRFTLKCLGVGDGWPCPDRNHSAFLYRFDNEAVLIDCGEPVAGSYKAGKLNYNLIDAIFLSHLHSDHSGGLFMLMQSFWLERRRKALPIYLPPNGIQPLREWLKAALMFERLLPFKLRLQGIYAKKSVVVGQTRVTAFPTSHLHGLQKRFPKAGAGLKAFCFLLEHGNRRIGHSADLGAPEDLAPLVREPLDLLVCELAHFPPMMLYAYL